MILFHFENVGNFHTQCSALLLNITFTVHFHYLIFMAQLPALSDLNILTPSGLLAEAVKLCSNTQMYCPDITPCTPCFWAQRH